MTIGTGKWLAMQPRANLIFSSKRRAPQFAKRRCAIGQSQKLDLENDSGILAALRFVAGAGTAIGEQMLPALAIGSKSSLDSVQAVGRSSDALFCAHRNPLPCDRPAGRRPYDLGLDRSSFGIRRVASSALTEKCLTASLIPCIRSKFIQMEIDMRLTFFIQN
jgi:hypothetical protein